MTSGIYKITNLSNGKCYIGSTVNFTKRWNRHKQLLRLNKHHAPHLQAAFNKYGADNFKWEILLICAKSDLIFYEQRALDTYKPEYNVAKVAGAPMAGRTSSEATRKLISQSLLGNKRSKGSKGHVGMKRSPEARRRMSIAQKNKGPVSEATRQKMSIKRQGRKPALGMRHTEETKIIQYNASKNRPKSSTKKLDIDTARLIRQEVISVKDIALKYGVSESTIYRVINNKLWIE